MLSLRKVTKTIHKYAALFALYLYDVLCIDGITQN